MFVACPSLPLSLSAAYVLIICIKKYTFFFLRSSENRMDSGNLAVIFAPNLLHSNENEKLSTSTEKKIRLQAAVVQTFIDHAEEIGK